ncbi:MAG TPA: acetate kinase [Methylophilaceae bacterium]|nr:acetate kinase [Methylophilaceae bacterium]
MKTALVFNSGSSSLKFGLYGRAGEDVQPLLHGAVELDPAAHKSGMLQVNLQDSRQLSLELKAGAQAEVVKTVAELLVQHGFKAPDVVGHRIVHGGPHVRSHCLISPKVMACLEAAQIYAPLHNAAALAVVRKSGNHFKGVPQAACLDTAFHLGMPDVARVLPLPRELQTEGIERYGFHGLSCESILAQLGEVPPPRLVIAHLGNGASITAVRNGCSVDTTMALTPTSGIPMSTRCGDIDPGVLIYLLREKKYNVSRLEDLLNRRSGLLGVSRLASDMRTLRKAAGEDADAALAVALFCQGVRKAIAAMAAVLEGIDLLVFTGGIGEHDAALREEVCAGLAWAGLDDSKVRVLPTQEEKQMAQHALQLLDQAR